MKGDYIHTYIAVYANLHIFYICIAQVPKFVRRLNVGYTMFTIMGLVENRSQ